MYNIGPEEKLPFLQDHALVRVNNQNYGNLFREKVSYPTKKVPLNVITSGFVMYCGCGGGALFLTGSITSSS